MTFAEIVKALRDGLTRQRPLSGPGIRVTETAAGTRISLASLTPSEGGVGGTYYAGAFLASGGATAGRVSVAAGNIMQQGQCLVAMAAVTNTAPAAESGTGAGYLYIRWSPTSSTAPTYRFSTTFPAPRVLDGSSYQQRVIATCTRDAVTGAYSAFSQWQFGDIDNAEPAFAGPFAVRKDGALSVHVNAGQYIYGASAGSYSGGDLTVTATLGYVYATLSYSSGYSFTVAYGTSVPSPDSRSVTWKLATIVATDGPTDICAINQAIHGDLHVAGRVV
jgi:hypothetical protein